MKKVLANSLFLLLIQFASCKSSPSVLGISDYIKYMQNCNNKMCSSFEVNNIVYTFRYQTPGLMVLRSLPGRSIGRTEYENNCKRYEGTVWMILEVSLKDRKQDPLQYALSGTEQYQKRLMYYELTAQNDFFLKYKGRNIAPFLYHFQNAYGITTSFEIITGYKMPDSSVQSDMVFSFNDMVFNNPNLKFQVELQDLQQLPELSLK